MYSGSWVSDKREGFGAYVFAKNGDQLVGEWRESNPTAWCQWLLGDGTVMQLDAASAATFKGAAPLGAASFTFISGLQQTGVFTAEDPDADGDSLALSWASKTTSAAPVAGAALVAQPDVPKASVAQRLLILSAPVGIGQDAAVDAMLAAYPDAFTVIAQHTSAADSGSARFTSVSADEMASLKEAGKFAESHEYDGAQVGTSVEAIDAARSSGKIGLISTDLNGCRTLKQAGFDALYAYIAPSEAKLAELFAPAPGASKEGEEEEDEAAAEAAAAAAEAMQAKLELASEELAAASEQAEVAGDEVPLFTEILASDDAAVVLEDLLDAVRVHIAPL
jgi:guanylate kinase|tara:strand:+ start:910 stop:1917 length:1008 start_codon:yes stop_codon:yes gene_type:complete